MDEKDLTPKQRRWLEASRKIGPGAMTRTERQTLERLYADMLPTEQQALHRYIQEHFGKKDDDREAKPTVQDPTELMERRVWTPPSDGLRKALARPSVTGPKSGWGRSGPRSAGHPDDMPSSVGDIELVRRFRSRARDLSSQGVQLDIERIEAYIAKLEGLQEDLKNLRKYRHETDQVTGTEEIHEKEKELDQAERELKRLIEPVSHLLD